MLNPDLERALFYAKLAFAALRRNDTSAVKRHSDSFLKAFSKIESYDFAVVFYAQRIADRFIQAKCYGEALDLLLGASLHSVTADQKQELQTRAFDLLAWGEANELEFVLEREALLCECYGNIVCVTCAEKRRKLRKARALPIPDYNYSCLQEISLKH